MTTATADFTHNREMIAQSSHQIRTGWTSQERRQRFVEGRRRFQELVRLVAVSESEPELWAAGALTAADLQRLAG